MYRPSPAPKALWSPGTPNQGPRHGSGQAERSRSEAETPPKVGATSPRWLRAQRARKTNLGRQRTVGLRQILWARLGPCGIHSRLSESTGGKTTTSGDKVCSDTLRPITWGSRKNSLTYQKVHRVIHVVR